MKKNLLIILIILLTVFIFKDYNLVLITTLSSVKIFLTKVFPYSFIMIIISDLLINLNITKYFKHTYIYLFLSSLLMGTPTSSISILNLYKNNIIDKSYANISLTYTSFCNPLFLYTILNNIFNNTFITIKLILINYLSNFIILLFNKPKLTNNKIKSNNTISLSSSINKSINTNLLILGTITFYFIITSILFKEITLPIYLKVLLQGLLEVTQGLNSLINLNIPFKEMLVSLFISFQGLSIHTQVKSILSNDLDYRYFLKGRIQACLISIFLTVIT